MVNKIMLACGLILLLVLISGCVDEKSVQTGVQTTPETTPKETKAPLTTVKATSSPTTPTPTTTPAVDSLVVGAWAGGGRCDKTTYQFGLFVCPKGRMRGFEKLDKYDFITCGTWSVKGDNLSIDYKATAVIDPTFTDRSKLIFRYQDDKLVWVSKCPITLSRLTGEVDMSDCTSTTCTAGGSGSIQCSADYQCGRCWYCESGTCRYGGEGPYGCYRGWEPPK